MGYVSFRGVYTTLERKFIKEKASSLQKARGKSRELSFHFAKIRVKIVLLLGGLDGHHQGFKKFDINFLRV